MSQLLNKLALGGLLAGLLALGLIRVERHIEQQGYDRGARETQEEVQRVADAQAAKNAEIQRRQIQTLTEARDAQQKRLQATVADHDRAVRELDGLRTTTRDGGSGDVPCATAETCAQYARAVADILGQCGAELIDVARAADGHAADALMLHQAWPE